MTHPATTLEERQGTFTTRDGLDLYYVSRRDMSVAPKRLVVTIHGFADHRSEDHNPPRVAPRHLLHLSVGTDNLFHKEHYRTLLRFTVSNLTNQASLYNFLSTFSGTHFVAPRTYQASLGFAF